MAERAEELVIAGAGLAGLALAAALHRDGRPCRLFDERPALGSSGGAITLWPNALAALDAIGVGDDVRRGGTAVTGFTARSDSGRLLRAVDPGRFERALGGPLVAIRRGLLVELLHDRVAAGSVTFGHGVRSHRVTGRGIEVTLDDGTTLTAGALVGADGYRSTVARGLGGKLRERYAGYPAWRGIAPVGGIPFAELWGAGEVFGMVPLDGDSTYWFATRGEPAGAVAAGGELAHLRAVFAGWPEEVGTLLEATPEDAVSRNDITDRASPRRWSDGPVTVIGDAAHPMRPHLGQGGCQALLDAAVLAERLRGSADPVAAFSAYAAARQGPALRITRLSRTAGRLVQSRVPLHRALPLLPERLLLRRLAAVGGRHAYRP